MLVVINDNEVKTCFCLSFTIMVTFIYELITYYNVIANQLYNSPWFLDMCHGEGQSRLLCCGILFIEMYVLHCLMIAIYSMMLTKQQQC